MATSRNKSDDTRAKLLEAAGGIFSQRGFRATTIREICRHAGTPIGTIHYHFKNKKGLYAAVLEGSHQESVRKYPPDAGLRPGAAPEEKLRAFIVSFLLRLSDEGVPGGHMKLIVQELTDSTGVLAALAHNALNPLYTYLVKIIYEVCQQAYPVNGEESQEVFLCAMSIIGQCFHYVTGKRIMAILHPKRFSPADIERIAGHITTFSLGGIRGISWKRSQ